MPERPTNTVQFARGAMTGSRRGPWSVGFCAAGPIRHQSRHAAQQFGLRLRHRLVHLPPHARVVGVTGYPKCNRCPLGND